VPGSRGSARDSLAWARFTEATTELVDELVNEWRGSCLSRDGPLLREAAPIWSPWNFGTLVNESVGHDSFPELLERCR
jgi:hypothetical protein